MGHNPTRDAVSDPRPQEPERVEAHPQDPQTNTRPRGNGDLDGREKDQSAQKLERVLGH